MNLDPSGQQYGGEYLAPSGQGPIGMNQAPSGHGPIVEVHGLTKVFKDFWG